MVVSMLCYGVVAKDGSKRLPFEVCAQHCMISLSVVGGGMGSVQNLRQGNFGD